MRSDLSRAALPFLMGLAACGDGGGGDGTPGRQAIAVNTLAYVVSECAESATEATAGQALRIRQRNGETVTVTELPVLGPLPPLGLCRTFGESSNGRASVVALPFQRLGVSPDGAVVVFELTDDHSILRAFFPPEGVVPHERESFFAVNADGSHLRKLGPASREPGFRFVFDSSVPFGSLANAAPVLNFSPDGQRVVFTDLGPGMDGQEAVQVFTLDLTTGERIQITRLPPMTAIGPIDLTVGYPSFVGVDSIGFGIKSVESDGFFWVLARADGTGEIGRFRDPVATGGAFVPRFTITSVSWAGAVNVAGEPVNPPPGEPALVSELFAGGGDNRLQLTRFGRSDTGRDLALVNADATRALFAASADPFGSNPNEGCQLFSISTLASDLRQITDWSNGAYGIGCRNAGPSCYVTHAGQDLASDSVLFASDCSPLDPDANGLELLAMRFDGGGLQQLSSTRGMTTDPDGTVHVELPGPWAYPDVFR